MFAAKLTKNTPDFSKTEEHYDLVFKKKGKKIIKYKKNVEKSNNGDIKSVTVGHPKTIFE